LVLGAAHMGHQLLLVKLEWGTVLEAVVHTV
jgi:hypothetical protein